MGGYKTLLIYRTAVTIYDFTVTFCDIWIDKKSRTHDQMVQAGRSGKQNIAEGSKELSSSSDLLLGSVSRSSYTELGEDYEDFLRQHGLSIWDKNDERILHIRAYKENTEKTTTIDDIEKWTQLDLKKPEHFANLMITLCYKQGYLMDQYLRSKEQKFIQEGGFRENLFKKRNQYKNKFGK